MNKFQPGSTLIHPACFGCLFVKSRLWHCIVLLSALLRLLYPADRLVEKPLK